MVELYRFEISPNDTLIGYLDPKAAVPGSLFTATRWQIERASRGSYGAGSVGVTLDLELREAELLLKALEINQRERHHQQDLEARLREQQRPQWRP